MSPIGQRQRLQLTRPSFDLNANLKVHRRTHCARLFWTDAIYLELCRGQTAQLVEAVDVGTEQTSEKGGLSEN